MTQVTLPVMVKIRVGRPFTIFLLIIMYVFGFEL